MSQNQKTNLTDAEKLTAIREFIENPQFSNKKLTEEERHHLMVTGIVCGAILAILDDTYAGESLSELIVLGIALTETRTGAIMAMLIDQISSGEIPSGS